MNTNADLLKILSGSAATMKFVQGQVITTEGDAGDAMYLLLAGKAGAYKNYDSPGRVLVAELGPGEFFGEISMFMNKPRSTSVVAHTETVIAMAIKNAEVTHFLETQPQVTMSLIQSLCRRLDDANRRMSGAPAKPVAAVRPAAPAAAKPAAAPTAAPAAAPAPAASGGAVNTSSDLFPQGHQSYSLSIADSPPELAYDKKYECPLCAQEFKAYCARDTKLKVLTRDKDFRVKHQDIDTTHYEMVTCPHCYYSNFDPGFKATIPSRYYPNTAKITAYKKDLNLTFGQSRKINEIFAGYYLALKGAELFHTNTELMEAKIWLRLMWLYQDCDDKDMEAFATAKAHKAYITAFENTDLSPAAAQQVAIIIGELSLRVDDLTSAKTYFTKARMHREGGQVMITMAEDGIEEIRKREGA